MRVPFRVMILSLPLDSRISSSEIEPVRSIEATARVGQMGARGSAGVITSKSSDASSMATGCKRVGIHTIGLAATVISSKCRIWLTGGGKQTAAQVRPG